MVARIIKEHITKELDILGYSFEEINGIFGCWNSDGSLDIIVDAFNPRLELYLTLRFLQEKASQKISFLYFVVHDTADTCAYREAPEDYPEIFYFRNVNRVRYA